MTSRPLTIALVAGEASGDLLGAGLIQSIKQHVGQVRFVGIPGPLMQQAGCETWFNMDELSVMGIVEVLARLPKILRIRAELRRRLQQLKPDVFIGIDAPDFNLALEKKLRQHGIPVIHYVSPSVWAWRQKRIFNIAKATNLVLALLPFEKTFYDRHQVPCRFIGHRLADVMPLQPDKAAARAALGIAPEAPCLAILPGSRAAEVAMLSEAFLLAAQQLRRQLPELQLIVPLVNHARRQQFLQIKQRLQTRQQLAADFPLHLVTGQARQVMTASDAALLASGTATLECMLAKCPMVVGYRMQPFTFWLAQRLVKTPYVALPNLLAGEKLAEELLQQDCTAEKLANALLPLLQSQLSAAASQRHQQLCQRFLQLHQQLRCNADEQAAQAVLELVS